MENKVIKAKDLAVDDVVTIYGCKGWCTCIKKLENGDVQVDYAITAIIKCKGCIHQTQKSKCLEINKQERNNKNGRN